MKQILFEYPATNIPNIELTFLKYLANNKEDLEQVLLQYPVKYTEDMKDEWSKNKEFGSLWFGYGND